MHVNSFSNMILFLKHSQRHCDYYHAITSKVQFIYITFAYNFCSSSISLVDAQEAIQNNDDPKSKLDPVYTGITLTIFVFLFFFSYITTHYCYRHYLQTRTGRRAHWADDPPRGGLDPSVLKAFPVFKYSEVSGLRPNKGPLECAVCLSLFEAHEKLRLLPKCDHVFHLDCVDTWLVGHSTCPLCRAKLEPQAGESNRVELGGVYELEGGGVHVVGSDVEDVEVRREIDTQGQFGKLCRFNSTGHVADAEGSESRDRYTLGLPDDVQNDDMLTLNRSRSCIITMEVD